MHPAPAKSSPRNLAQRLKRRILRDYFVRIHMGLILAAVIASGVLTSKLLLEWGVRSLRFRYPVAVLGSYLVFMLLVRMWIAYVARRRAGMGNLDPVNVDVTGGSSGSGSGSGGSVRFGGGDSGGGGASGIWEGETCEPVPHSSPALPHLDLGLDDDGWWILVVLALLLAAIFCCGGYLIYAAPEILPEAACQAVLASSLTRISKEHHHGWMPGVLRSTAAPFAIVTLFALALGWAAHAHCPEAGKLMEALRCAPR